MLAGLLRLLLVLELILAVAIGRALGLRSWPEWLLALGAIAVAWRLAVAAAIFLLAAALRPPGPRAPLGAVRRLSFFLHELCALSWAYTALMAFPRRPLPDDPVPTRLAAADRLPIILVHGIYCNGGIWRATLNALDRKGVGPLFAPDFDTLRSSIDQQAARLAAIVDQVRRHCSAQRVLLVGHSMGGLVARCCIARHGGAHVARLITIGCPHHGSRLARIAFGPGARAMVPGSDWLRWLQQQEAAVRDVPVSSILSPHDELVIPPESARLDGADNVELAGQGHVALLFCPGVWDRVAREWEAASAARSASPA